MVSLAILVSLWVWIGATRLEGFSWEDDEGTFLASAQSAFVGHPLYREVWFNYLPGFMGILTVAFHVGGVTVEAARSVIVVFAGLLLIGLAELARQLAGRKAGILAAVLLVTTPNFVRLGRAVMAEVPATAFTLWALLAALWYLRSGHSLWLIVSGLLTSGAILIKFPSAVTIVPVAGVVLLRSIMSRESVLRWRLIAHLGLLALSIAGPIIISVIPFNLPLVWNQIVSTYLNSRSAYNVVLSKNVVKLVGYFNENNWGLVMLTCVGLVCLFQRNRAEGWLGTAWLVSYLVSILAHSPLIHHHLFLILVPATLLAGTGIAHFVRLNPRAFRSHQPLLLAALCLGLGAYIFGLPRMLEVTVGRLKWAGDARKEEWTAVQLVSQHTAPEDYVISDFPMITFRAQRQAPPWLANLSGMRFRTGGITERDLLQDTLNYQVQAVVMWENKLYKKAPQYVSWVEQRCYPVYHHVKADHADADDDKVRRILICPRTQYPQEALFEEALRLQGYSLSATAIDSGDTLEVILYYQMLAPTSQRHHGFVHLLTPDGLMVAQEDQALGGTHYPSTVWEPGKTIVEHYEVLVPTSAAPGSYLLSVGLYDQETKHRLAVREVDGQPLGGDQLILGIRPVVRGPAQYEAPAIEYPVGVRLGQAGRLVGYSLSEREGELEVELVWEGLTPPIELGYTVFVHLRGEGTLVAQHDGVPGEGRSPTVGWRRGEFITDRHTLPLTDVPEREYSLLVGMYDPATGERVPVFDASGARLSASEADLGPVTVQGAR
jgi:4-amino-4-deoxy-L-arabinose transferase-like glycosyltransferase